MSKIVVINSLGIVGIRAAMSYASERLRDLDLFNHNIGKISGRKANRKAESRTRCAEYSPNSPEVILMTKQFWQSASQKNKGL